MECNDKLIGKNIKSIRNANRKSIYDFANDIGISDSLLGKLENGSRHATDEIIQLISEKTGFSFNMIKYKNLTSLEKGEMCFDEGISLYEIEEDFEFSSIFYDIFKLMFPIAVNEEHLANENFRSGISIVHDKIQVLNCSTADCIKAINYFINASSVKELSDFSAINILSCFGYLYILSINVYSIDSDTLLKEKASSISDICTFIQSSIDKNKTLMKKKRFIENYNGLLTKYMRKLVESGKNSDFAYYYLYIRYSLGMMDETITLIDENQMKIFSETLFDSMWKMGNKYAKALHEYELE